ncbi:hypothetical protein EDD86DRAFT_256946 [Gorgonomyces haynaldii]|nr:hypothetical protein EDD86DRAFT_256946 [Gorgonomyces haynaldii]
MPLQYLFSYGSLINPESRRRTLQHVTQAIPVVVEGLKRSWSYKCPVKSYTALSVERSPGYQTNGVLIPIESQESLRLLDERERHYSRGLIDTQSITFLDQKIDEDALIWVYELPNPQLKNHSTVSQQQTFIEHRPSVQYPIPQSYLDCCLSGCLLFGEAFTLQFIESTFGWAGVWLNDRHFCKNHKKYVPRQEIGEKQCPLQLKQVDQLLLAVLPQEFRARLQHPNFSLQ